MVSAAHTKATTVLPHLTVAERTARGKAARAEVPRSSHGTFEPAPTRPDPVELLERQARTRVPELVPIRYGRMMVSPFTFYRGAAKVLASDLASTPNSGLTVQCCGDAHLSNFGLFASPERRLVFDINDFDETLPGPWEWDVKRLTASLVVAARDNGFPVKDQDRIVLDTAAEYRSAMREFAAMPNLAVWYARAEAEELIRDYGSQITRKQARRTEPFLLITLEDIVTGGKALRDRRLLVWLYIKYRAWKESSNTVAIGNRNLQSWGVSPWTKCRALRDFERAGLISVVWRERTSPVVTLTRL